ncbi:MAG: hypothetical protein LQ342_006195 [Letrouitia transgressa]|nr:MAG: hypothetical protein LQ342_006195 [Letrouitia transgressa]
MDSTEQNAHSQNSSIGFIPPQMDPEASTSTRALRENPLLLFIKDAGILITVLPYLPLLFFPLKTADQSAELSISKASIASYAIPVALFAAELAGLLLAIPAFLVLPGGYFFALLVLFCFSMILLALPTQGPRIVHSVVSDDTAESMASHNDERWLFVNGIATGHSGLQNNVDRISLTFGRPVIGIHNRSYGLISDLLECLIQRTMSFNSKDVRVTYEYVKAYLSEPAIKKVVLVAHSQGGIIISMVLDHLFSELPSSIISKLEIYTFGSAAAHFHNPALTDPDLERLPSTANFSTLPHYIRYIEHYCNEYDMVPRWGVLYSIKHLLKNRYAGRVFVQLGASGHLLIQHYLDTLFPLSSVDFRSNKGSGKSMSNKFLKSKVKVGENVWFQGGENTPHVNGALRGMSAFRDPRMAEETEGKTVKELSRLWMYLGGASPND